MGSADDVYDAVGLKAMPCNQEADGLCWGLGLNLEVIHLGGTVCEYVSFHFRRNLSRACGIASFDAHKWALFLLAWRDIIIAKRNEAESQ